ncbi:ABC transporter permease [Dethiothermospora halolimnae]|uniref:ABC transporter permease n=1 Tax=Dethiothermospora halolimnae TaxID=3114390 RepID=UPI003CCC3311
MLSIMMLRLQKLKRDYFIYLLMMIMAFAFTLVVGGLDSSYKPTVLIVDNDNSEYSNMLIKELKDNNGFKYKVSEKVKAIEAIENNNANSAVIIDKGLQNDIKKGINPSIGIAKLKEDQYTMTIENMVSSITTKMITNINISKDATDYITQYINKGEKEIFDSMYDKTMEAWKYRVPIKVKRTILDAGNNKYDQVKHGLIGFTLFFTMYSIVFSVGEILQDRKYNTWQRILISPISKTSILGGNLVVSFILGFLQIAILIMGGKYMLGVDMGPSMIGVLLIIIAFVFAVTSLGLLLSGVVKNHGQLSAITPIVLTSTAMLGGCFWPIEAVDSKIILVLSNITPQKWAIEGIEKMAMYGYGFSFETVILPTIVLVAMGAVFFGIGVRLVGLKRNG